VTLTRNTFTRGPQAAVGSSRLGSDNAVADGQAVAAKYSNVLAQPVNTEDRALFAAQIPAPAEASAVVDGWSSGASGELA
jgi:hypothetical protein